MTRPPLRRALAAGLALAAAGLLAAPAAARQSAAGSSSDDASPSAPKSNRSAATLMLQGPTGDDVLSLTRNPPRQARAGQEVNYLIDVKNVSDFPVQGVVVRESFRGGFEVVSANAKGDEEQSDGGAGKSGGKKKSGG